MSIADKITLLLIFVLQIAIYVSNINHLNNVLFEDSVAFIRYWFPTPIRRIFAVFL